jgi:hypothetical protein
MLIKSISLRWKNSENKILFVREMNSFKPQRILFPPFPDPFGPTCGQRSNWVVQTSETEECEWDYCLDKYVKMKSITITAFFTTQKNTGHLGEARNLHRKKNCLNNNMRSFEISLSYFILNPLIAFNKIDVVLFWLHT